MERSARLPAAIVCALLLLLTAAPASAAVADYEITLLGKAAPDECFAGIGKPYPPGPPCARGQAKVNQGYVWGMARAGGRVWFGTGANAQCLTSGSSLGETTPVANDDFVCEYGESRLARSRPLVPDALGDARPPEVWVYDEQAGSLTEKTPQITGADRDRLRDTIGLRAAGSLDGVVLLAGPTLNGTLNMFAFDDASGRFLGSETLLRFSNARTFVVAEGGLYVGVGTGAGGSRGGAVLHWTGGRLRPFEFEQVGTLPTQAADLTVLDGRLYATTWAGSGGDAGLWRSPELPIPPRRAGQWTEVFDVGQYEPDPVVRGTYGLGGIAAFDGYVYWGSMHVPMQATIAHQRAYPPADEAARQAQARFTQRAAAIWRGRDLGTPDQKIELLYGERALPAYDPSAAAWSSVPTGFVPSYGASGFGNAYNNYTWRMAVSGGTLYVGTMDWSYLFHLVLQAPPPSPSLWGADLWAFADSQTPAAPVDTTGLGNYLNYGVRTLVPADDGGLVLGAANPMNLRTDRADDVPEGGWELLRLRP